MKLLLTAEGGAQLTDDSELNIKWSSDNDPDFKDEFQDDFISEDELTELFEYLETKGVITEDDIEDIEIFSEQDDSDDDDEDDLDDSDDDDTPFADFEDDED